MSSRAARDLPQSILNGYSINTCLRDYRWLEKSSFGQYLAAYLGCLTWDLELTDRANLDAARCTEARLDAAIIGGAGQDTDLILLALHSGVINPETVERFEIEVGRAALRGMFRLV